MKFLKLFDAASVTECYQRSESVVPQQALALANSDAGPRAIARLLAAARWSSRSARTPTAFVDRRVRARPGPPADRRPSSPSASRSSSEQARGCADPAKLTAPSPARRAVTPAADPRLRARENLVHVLFNHNDFVTIR